MKKVEIDDITQADAELTEAKQLQSISHPNIVKYVDDFIHTEFGGFEP
jgi:hypothetical protein